MKDLEPVDWDNNMFTNLILAQQQKELLNSLVLSHSSAPDEESQKKTEKGKDYTSSQSVLSNSRDFTETKGKGLVVVLHGPPGTGKTMTAGISSVKRVCMKGVVVSILLMINLLSRRGRRNKKARSYAAF